MNRYIIAGKGDIYNDNSDLTKYFELGWEVSTTHVDIKYLYSIGYLDVDDIIVTSDDRKFFYEGLFNNVISWNEYITSKNNILDVIDLVDNTINFHHNKPNDKNLIWDTITYIPNEIISNFNYDNININNKQYVCLAYRSRNHSNNRNMNDEYFTYLINSALEINYDVYVIGVGGEKFANNTNVFYVNLKEGCTLLNNENCKYIISTMTGTANLTFFCNSLKTQSFILDLGMNRSDGSNRIISGNCLNMRKIKTHFVGRPTKEELMNYIKSNI